MVAVLAPPPPLIVWVVAVRFEKLKLSAPDPVVMIWVSAFLMVLVSDRVVFAPLTFTIRAALAADRSTVTTSTPLPASTCTGLVPEWTTVSFPAPPERLSAPVPDPADD